MILNAKTAKKMRGNERDLKRKKQDKVERNSKVILYLFEFLFLSSLFLYRKN